MYFTLAVSAATAGACAALAGAAQATDPRVIPVPGPARAGWRAPDGRAAMLHWGPAGITQGSGSSQAGTIWAEAGAVRARTALTRVDPVYLAEIPGAVVISDRASWAAAVAGRLRDFDPVLAGAFLSLGYPIGGTTPFRGVRALGGGRSARATGGRLAVRGGQDRDQAGPGPGAMGAVDPGSGDPGAVDPGAGGAGAGGAGAGGAGRVARALTEAVRPLRDVELSLTGGKDSRLIAAALTAAGVPFRARTHGFAQHPDVIVAKLIAGRLGLEHTVTGPAAPHGPDSAEVLRRLRTTVLVSDGMLSAFENTGRPDPLAATGPVQSGGHGGELLRGGYATAAWGRRGRAAAGAELFRRLTTRRLGLLRPAAAAAYLTALVPPAAALARGPLHGLDDFYLENRAGRWSAAARQAYLIRSPLVQPFFADPVVRAARAVPLRQRLDGRLHRDVLARLCPALSGIPLAGRPGPGGAPDWRLDFGAGSDLGADRAAFLRSYVLDAGPMFDVVSRPAAERVLRSPRSDPQAVWALATLAALVSGDWLSAREPDPASRGRTGSPPARSTAPRPAG